MDKSSLNGLTWSSGLKCFRVFSLRSFSTFLDRCREKVSMVRSMIALVNGWRCDLCLNDFRNLKLSSSFSLAMRDRLDEAFWLALTGRI